MDETKLTAHLPNLQIEIVRREDPAANAEILTLNLRAVPSFEAFGRYLFGPTMAASQLATANPFELWIDLWRRAWAPWLDGAESMQRIARGAAAETPEDVPARRRKPAAE
jgi:hypothetical protein